MFWVVLIIPNAKYAVNAKVVIHAFIDIIDIGIEFIAKSIVV